MTEKKYFLSHSGADRDEARCIAERLLDLGIGVWCDVLPGNLEPGQSWVSGLQGALEDCSGYLILIGERAISGWVEAELQYALNRNAREEGFLVLPILMTGVMPERLPALLQRFQVFPLSCKARDLSEEHLLELSRTLESEEARELTPEDPNTRPFPGLASFQERDARFYFGRHEVVLDLVINRLGPVRGGFRRWLEIESSSGSGKSSFLRAGLIPAVRRGWLDGSRDWSIVISRPGHDPLRNLVNALEARLGRGDKALDVDSWCERLRSSPGALADLVAQYLPEDAPGLLLILDQFEEVFTLPQEPAELLPPLDRLLSNLVRNKDSRCLLVTACRSDFTDRFSLLPELEALLNDELLTSRFRLGPIEPEALKVVISGPARLAKLTWQNGELPNRIHKDACEGSSEGGIKDMTPLASALNQLWTKREVGQLSADEYDRMGGVSGALATGADALLAILSDEEKKTAQVLLLALVFAPSEPERPLSRKTLSREDALSLINPAGSGHSQDLAETVLSILSTGRRPEKPSPGPDHVRLIVIDEGRVDLAHERLTTHWPTLQRWVNDQRAVLIQRDRLEVLAREYWVHQEGEATEGPRGRRSGIGWKLWQRLDGLLSSRQLSELREASKLASSDARRYWRRSRGWQRRKRLLAGLALATVLLCALLQLEKEWRTHRATTAALSTLNLCNLLTRDVQEMDRLEGRKAAKWLQTARRTWRRMTAMVSSSHSEVEAGLRREELWGRAEEELDRLRLRIKWMSYQVEGWRCKGGGLESTWEAAWDQFEVNAEASLVEEFRKNGFLRHRKLMPLPAGSGGRAGLKRFALADGGGLPRWSENGHPLSGRMAVVLRYIPGDTFVMGDLGPGISSPAHVVRIRQGFFIGQYEVTRAQYRRYRWLVNSRYIGINRPYQEALPHTCHWFDAKEYAEAIGARLPTEAEWEYACRSGEEGDWCIGANEDDLNGVAWYGEGKLGEVHPVGQKEANNWGIHDMHGNVWEWCSDWIGPYSERSSADPVGPIRGSERVLRGGCIRSDAANVRSACRYWASPKRDNGLIGFRIVWPGASVD